MRGILAPVGSVSFAKRMAQVDKVAQAKTP